MKRLFFIFALVLIPNSLGQQTGSSAPNFTLINQAGEVVSLDDLLGTPLIINMWATWCPPCREELPLFERVFEEVNQLSETAVVEADELFLVGNTDPSLSILLVNNGEKADQAVEYLAANGITLPSGVNPTDEQRQHWQEQDVNLEETLAVVRRYRVRGMPTTFYIDSQGIIRVVKIGLVTESSMIKDLRSIGVTWIPSNQE